MGDGRKVKLSERTADRLYELIMEERQFAPGSKLPNENELSESLHVSRTTLREAISFLVAQRAAPCWPSPTVLDLMLFREPCPEKWVAAAMSRRARPHAMIKMSSVVTSSSF